MVDQRDEDRIRTHVALLPFDATTKRRILMTVECSDTRLIPKIPGAGSVFDRDGSRFQLMHNGVRILENCYYGPWMTELIRLLNGHHEPQEERVFHDLLKCIRPKATMIELGSFWSYYSLWFQHCVPEASTYMVEPDPNNLDVGRRNFALNGRSGRFLNYAIARASSAAAPLQCESDSVVRNIPRISVDDLIRQNGIAFVDLLLADIQGAELQMLEGAEQSIAESKIRFVVISTHHHSISKDPILHQRCLQFLKQRQAHIIAAHSVSESYSGDGLIAASFAPADRQMPSVQISKNNASNSLFRELEFDLAESWDTVAALRREMTDLRRANDLQSQDLQALRQRAAHSEALVSEKDALIGKVLGSLSWKISRPVRVIGQFLRNVNLRSR